jgi:hypothetical protein
MATTVTLFPAPQLGKGFYKQVQDEITTLIAVGHITTASTIAELQTALTGELANDDPRS